MLLSAWISELRSPSSSLDLKLDLAEEHLNSAIIHHPGKLKFLLEWISGVLLKGRSDEKGIPPIAQTRCWIFLRQLLQKAVQESSLPALKYPLLPSHSQWCRHWVAILDQQEKINEQELDTFQKQLDIVKDCWEILSLKISRYLLATMDQTLQLAADSIDLMTTSYSKLDSNETSIISMVKSLFIGIWSRLLDYISRQGNLKKLYSFTAEKILGQLLFLYHTLSAEQGSGRESMENEKILSMLSEYISKTLFSKTSEHIKDMEAPLKAKLDPSAKSNGSGIKNYTVVLFDQLETLCQNPDWDLRIDGFPFLLSQLISSSDKNSCLVFSFFQFLDNLLFTRDGPDDIQKALKARYDMLKLLCEHSIYRPTNDQISKDPRAFLETLAKELVTFKNDTGFVSKIWSTLLNMDYALVESRLNELLDHMAKSNSNSDSLNLAQELVLVFHKSRKLDSLLLSVLSVAESGMEVVEFFDSSTLEALAHSVSVSLPAQSMHFFATLFEHLADVYESVPSSKLSKKKFKNTSKSTKVELFSSASPTVALLEVVVKHMRVSAGQQATFYEICQKFKGTLLQAALEKLSSHPTDENFGAIVNSRIVPTLQLHYHLMLFSDSYWTHFVTGEEILTLLKRTNNLTSYPLLIEIRTRIALLHIDRVASICLDPKADPICVEIMRLLNELTSLDTAAFTLNHLSAVCRLASPDQIQAIVVWIIKAIESGDPTIHRMCLSASFFEVREIRGRFFKTWMEAVLKKTNKAFKCKSGTTQEFVGLQEQILESDVKLITEKLELLLLNGLKLSLSVKRKGRKELTRLIAGLCFFPIHYFTVLERRKIVLSLFILHILGTSLDEGDSEWSARLLYVLNYFIDECQDSFVLTHSPLMLKTLLEDAAKFERAIEPAMSVFKITIYAVQSKPSLTAYLSEVTKWLLSSPTDRRYFVKDLFTVVNEFLESKKSWDPTRTKQELQQLIPEAIADFDKSTLSIDMIRQVLRFYYLTSQVEKASSILNQLQEYETASTEMQTEIFNMSCEWLHLLKRNAGNLQPYLDQCRQLLANDRGVIDGFVCLMQTSSEPEQLQIISWILQQFGTPATHVSKLVFVLLQLLNSDQILVGKLLPGYRINEILNRLFMLIRKDKSFNTLQGILELLCSLTMNKKIHLKTFQVSQIFTVLGQFSSGGKQSQDFNDEEREKLYQSILQLLNGLIRHRRESIINLIPILFHVISDLLECFREDPLTISVSLKNEETPPPFCAILCPRLKPLGPRHASLFSNLLLSLTQKPSMENGPETNEPHLRTQNSTFIRPFSKHAPLLLLSMVSIQSSRRPFDTECKKELMDGVYYVLDLCNDHGRSFALAALDAHGGGRPILKTWVSDWEKYHRFRGDA